MPGPESKKNDSEIAMWKEALRPNSRCNLLSVSVDKDDWKSRTRKHAKTILAKYTADNKPAYSKFSVQITGMECNKPFVKGEPEVNWEIENFRQEMEA